MPAPIRYRSMLVPAAASGPNGALTGRLLAVLLGLSGILSLVGMTMEAHPAEVLLRLGVAVGGMSLSVALWGAGGCDRPAADLPLAPQGQAMGQGRLWLRLLPLWGALGFVALLLGAIWSEYSAVL